MVFLKRNQAEFGGQVPQEYVEQYDKKNVNMIGRGKFNDKVFCKSLTGEIGKGVLHTIYGNRPSVCRAFEVISPEEINHVVQKQKSPAGLNPWLE